MNGIEEEDENEDEDEVMGTVGGEGEGQNRYSSWCSAASETFFYARAFEEFSPFAAGVSRV